MKRIFMAGLFASFASGALPADESVVHLKCMVVGGVAVAYAVEMKKKLDSFGLCSATVYLQNQSSSSIRISAKQSEVEPYTMLDLATRAFIMIRTAFKHPFDCNFYIPCVSWRSTAVGVANNDNVEWQDFPPETESCVIEPYHFFTTTVLLTSDEMKAFKRCGMAALLDIAVA